MPTQQPLLLLLSLSSLFIFTTSDDGAALLAFKSTITHDPSNFLSNWISSTHYCQWRGISCNTSNNRVVSVNLTTNAPSSMLAGTLSFSIGNLTDLRVFSIPHHALSGEIPSSIGDLIHLDVLELQGNNFSGKIPKQISNLSSSLRLLNLSFNFLIDKIPASLGNIRVVDLSDNQLSGKITVGHGHDCFLLRHLKLSNNFLVGNIPAEIGKCLNLRTLLLDGNILEGSIPSEIGQLLELRVFDVSRNSLTDVIPWELGNCRKLAVLVLTNLVEYSDDRALDIFRGEYNAFVGGVPREVFMISVLQVLWAPRGNIGGRLPDRWSEFCSLRVFNLGQNYIDGVIPEGIARCRNLTFLDLSSNGLSGNFPLQLQVSCMRYLNVSRNLLSGPLLPSAIHNCGGINLEGKDLYLLDGEDSQNFDSGIKFLDPQLYDEQGAASGHNLNIKHDFGWNNFTGSLPIFSLSDGLFISNSNATYELYLNDNGFNGSLPGKLLTGCPKFHSVFVNLTANEISGELYPTLLQDCLELTSFEAAQNQVWGSISPSISNLLMLSHLDLRENRLSGSLPKQFGDMKTLRSLLLGGNNFTGDIPPHLGNMASLEVLDLSKNNLKGQIPNALANASNLTILLLDHNGLTDEIPLSFSSLTHLVELDVSFNNLTGRIPHIGNTSDCESFKGNRFLHSCPDPYSAPPAGLPVPLEVENLHKRNKKKAFIIAAGISVSVVIGVLMLVVLGLSLGRKKLGRLTCLRRKVVVTFAVTPVELTYDNVVSATGNFSIRNLIGTGGFGSTYKAELVPGYLVAVKRLSLGRFQGIQQFEAEIKTLGRVRHKNLVTLIGYYVGDTEMFLIYNYLSGGNLETFIHDRSVKNIKWLEIYKITVDVAHALAYLHYSCVPRIVHRDIKPSNILLDEDLNSYLSDFGLARLLEVSQTHATTDVAGTFGYVAPEYATTCRVTDKADVYSFGVVLLELMSGKKSLDPSFSEYGNGFNIVGWAMLLMDEGRCSEFFYSELWEAGAQDNLLKMLQLALSCTVESLTIRPSMKQVLEKLKQLSS